VKINIRVRVIQFLNCMYQMVQLYPECFEFNTKLLISEHVNSCHSGDFLCDTECKCKLFASIQQCTHLMLDYLETWLDIYQPSYCDSNNGMGSSILLMPLPTLLCNVSLWTKCHCQHSTKLTMQWLPLAIVVANQSQSILPQPLPLYTWQEVYQKVWSLSLSGHSGGGGGSGPGKLHREALYSHLPHHNDNNNNSDNDPLKIPGSFTIND